MKNKPFHINTVLFDFDGTLTLPDALDLSIIKNPIGCPLDVPYLEFVETLPPNERENALSVLKEFELDAAANSKPNPAAEDLIYYLRSKGLSIGIVSNNTRQSLDRALQNFNRITATDFDVIISRDDPADSKPSPDGILMAAHKLDTDVRNILMIGDYVFDIHAGKAAGVITVFLDEDFGNRNLNPDVQNWKLETRNISMQDADFVISDLKELRDIVRLGIPLPSGKFPNALLKGVLEQFAFHDPSVLINPGIGEDIAAVDVDKEEVLVLKSDPITFATDSVSHYAVLVNANDIATSGAVPRWFLTTLLFPCGTTPSEIFHVMHGLKDVCREWGITLCGGHTEITDAVTRPVVTGMLAGTVARQHLINKRDMKSGDRVLFTKGVAVEGTSIIAREFGDRLKELGMIEEEIETSRNFLSRISILREARIAARFPGVTAMHDVTEGGLATALEELSIAGQHKVRVETDKIPVIPETEKICKLLNINPLGLIGSGSLLICCKNDTHEVLVRKIQDAGINVSVIGEITAPGQGLEAVNQGIPAEFPNFEADEITRLF